MDEPPDFEPMTPRATRAAPRGEPTVEYDFDQRPEAGGRPFARGDAVVHDALGEGLAPPVAPAPPDGVAPAGVAPSPSRLPPPGPPPLAAWVSGPRLVW